MKRLDGSQALAQADTRALIDPRVAAHGGTRRSIKAHYEFPGMQAEGSWRRTDVHQHTAFYGCALCGVKFTSPNAVYVHLAKRHDR